MHLTPRRKNPTAKSVETRSSPAIKPQSRDLARWSLAYLLVSLFTGSFFMADTVDYVAAVVLHDRGIDYVFWDFRHLLWRPLGWLLLHAIGPLIQPFTNADPKTQVVYIFLALNWLAGLGCVLLLRAILDRFSIRRTVANLVTLGFLFSLSFLNYSHAGSSYIPGLAFLMLGFYLLAVPAQTPPSPWRSWWAALALAASVCLWFPYVFAVPGTLATPLFHSADSRWRWKFTLRTTILCLIFGLAGYAAILVHLRIFTLHAALAWITTGAKDVAGVRGPQRAIFGLARSFIHMGEDAVLFKRFLLHDPYNPVGIFQLIRVSLFKLSLFYALLLSILIQLLRSAQGKRILWLCLLTALPVMVFALLWFGGDLERYLPLYPAFFLALAYSLSDESAPRYLKWVGAALLLIAAFSNLGATSRSTVHDEQHLVEQRVQDLLPRLKPASRVVTLDIHDELVNFKRTYLLNPINRDPNLRLYPALNPGTPQTLTWRPQFASTVLSCWQSGADVWLSQRVLAPRPDPDWKWVEGSDAHVTWNLVHSFFSQFDLGTSVGGKDGFVLLLPTKRNRDALTLFTSAHPE